MESMSHIPPGYRFHPTDEELVDYYLKKKVAFPSLQVDVIKDVDLYKIEPWDIQELCGRGTGEEREWYFYSHKDKKYPTGTRTNRATGSGFWKATGRDKAIYSKQELVGMRKTLVFYKGRAPNGQKSDWIMHEYRLETDENGPPHEEGWVVCRAFKKKLTINYNNNNSRTMMMGSSSNQESNWFGQQMDVNNGNNYYHLPDLESPRMFQSSSSSSMLMPSHHHNNDDVYGTILNTINNPMASHDNHMVMMNNHHQDDDNDDDNHHDNDQVMDWQTLDKFVASQFIMNQGDEEDQVSKDLSNSSQRHQTFQNLSEEQQRMVSMNVSSSSSPSSFYSWSQNTHT